MKFKNNFKKINEEIKIKKNKENKTEFEKLQNDKAKIDFIARHLGFL